MLSTQKCLHHCLAIKINKIHWECQDFKRVTEGVVSPRHYQEIVGNYGISTIKT